jgi:hypothetical protein
MSENVKLMANLDRHDDSDTVDAAVLIKSNVPSLTYWRKWAAEAAEALHKVRPDLRADRVLERVFLQFDHETFSPDLLVAAREAFVERWKHLQASAPPTQT